MRHIGNIGDTTIRVFMEEGPNLYRRVSCVVRGILIEMKEKAVNSEEAKKLVESYLKKEKGLI